MNDAPASMADAPAPLASLTGDRLRQLRASEWVLTNGLGGFAMGTVSGTPERRYHALLVAATKPPVGRVASLFAVDERVVVAPDGPEGRPSTHQLTTFRFGGACESGTPISTHLVRFERAPGVCRWEFEVREQGVRITRELALVPGRNAAILRYRVSSPLRRAWLELRPLVALRDFHRTLREHEGVWRYTFDIEGAEGPTPKVSIAAEGTRLRLGVSAPSHFLQERWWWRNFEYRRDLDRGQQDGRGDLMCPGAFMIECHGETTFELGATCDDAELPRGLEAIARAASEQTHADVQRSLRGGSAHQRDAELEAAIPALLHAADQFIVARPHAAQGAEKHGVSIIAGYPWFSDWGRDTMISLRGLLLARGLFREAKATLDAFAAHLRNGLIPNCFDDASGGAEYNTVDAPLWFIQAACDYAEQSGDAEGFSKTLLPACLEIVRAFRDGTDFDIRMDADGLIAAGREGTQLTWMDAKRDGVVFTPRHGKPVEINALWISGLRRLAGVLAKNDAARANEFATLADRASDSFREKFWDRERRCLFDCLAPERDPSGHVAWVPNRQVRPNQIFAVSLPHSPLTLEQQRDVLACVRQHLLTPMGLRTLAPSDPQYRPRFEGSLFERDRAYHNGTVWPWLIGAYAEAVIRAGENSPQSRVEAREAITPLLGELCQPAGSVPSSVATLVEVYDAEDSLERPRRGDGCMAQAWSIAELLRIVTMLNA